MTVLMTPFQREVVRASHQAMGVPTSSKSTVTTLANFNVSQIAERSEALIVGIEGTAAWSAAASYSVYPYERITARAAAPFRNSKSATAAGLDLPALSRIAS